MIRKIIKINEEECNGCGRCAESCHEGAIGMVAGKAKLLRDDYCDGLGECLPTCPMGAITFEEREAAAFNEAAAQEHLNLCVGLGKINECRDQSAAEKMKSELRQWPIQIDLAPENAPYFDDANLLIAAGCTAFAYGNFHRRFIRNHVVLIGCSLLDKEDFTEKLAEIFRRHGINSVTIVRMETPCCDGMVQRVRDALTQSCKPIPWHVETITIDGKVLHHSEAV